MTWLQGARGSDGAAVMQRAMRQLRERNEALVQQAAAARADAADASQAAAAAEERARMLQSRLDAATASLRHHVRCPRACVGVPS